MTSRTITGDEAQIMRCPDPEDVASRLTDSKPLQRAGCKCGHEGKSKNPKFYQCGFCYYSNWAAHSERAIADKLVQVKKLRVEVMRCKKKAADFRKRHPLEGKS